MSSERRQHPRVDIVKYVAGRAGVEVWYEVIRLYYKLLPMFTAGAHLDIELGNGLARQYSISSDPRDVDRYVVAVLREPESRGGSVYMHDNVSEGDVLAPNEAFCPVCKIVVRSPRELREGDRLYCMAL